jgi:hypothetical protein
VKSRMGFAGADDPAYLHELGEVDEPRRRRELVDLDALTVQPAAQEHARVVVAGLERDDERAALGGQLLELYERPPES